MLYPELQEVHAKTYLPSHWHLWLQNQRVVLVSPVGQPSSQSLCTGNQLAATEIEENVKAVLGYKL